MIKDDGRTQRRNLRRVESVLSVLGSEINEEFGLLNALKTARSCLTYVTLHLTYVRVISRAFPGWNMASRGIRPDLTYVTLRLTYVNHTETQHTYSNRRKNGVWPKRGSYVRKTKLTYVSPFLMYVRCTLTYVSHHFPPILVSLCF